MPISPSSPASLRDRPLQDPLVVDALEEWASREAARIMVGLFIVAAGVSVLAIPPSLVLGGRPRMLTRRPGRRLTRPPPPEAPIPMAAKRPRPASRSDPSGPTTVSEVHGGEPHDAEATEARPPPAAPGSSASSRSSTVRGRNDRREGPRRSAGGPAPADGERVGRPVRAVARAGRAGGHRAWAPPARRRGRPRGQSAREDRDHRGHRPHRPVLPRLRREL